MPTCGFPHVSALNVGTTALGVVTWRRGSRLRYNAASATEVADGDRQTGTIIGLRQPTAALVFGNLQSWPPFGLVGAVCAVGLRSRNGGEAGLLDSIDAGRVSAGSLSATTTTTAAASTTTCNTHNCPHAQHGRACLCGTFNVPLQRQRQTGALPSVTVQTLWLSANRLSGTLPTWNSLFNATVNIKPGNDGLCGAVSSGCAVQ